MRHHVKVGAFRLREHSQLLGCERLHGVGFQARCECGEKSRVVPSHAAARAWAAEHVEMSKANGVSTGPSYGGA